MEIEGYPNYLIYPDGRVWSKYKKNYLKFEYNHNQYLRTTLYNNNNRKKYFVHRLVALHYIPNPNNFNVVNHKNGIVIDNRVENLEWCSSKYNNQSINKPNTSIGCIYKCCDRNKWAYEITIYEERYRQRFDTEEEAECQRIIMTSMLEG